MQGKAGSLLIIAPSDIFICMHANRIKVNWKKSNEGLKNVLNVVL